MVPEGRPHDLARREDAIRTGFGDGIDTMTTPEPSVRSWEEG